MSKQYSYLKKTALVSALLLELSTGAQAGIIAVDGTTCTLSDAITAANTDTTAGGCTAGSGTDVLELPLNGNLLLTSGIETITSQITINANGTNIERNVNAANFRIFTLQAGGDLTLNDAIVTNGAFFTEYNNSAGGVRAYDATLNINNSVFEGNAGGAILFTRSSGSVNNTLVQNGTSFATNFYGAGISVANSAVDITNSTITNNSNIATDAGGGGVYVTNYGGPSTVNITNSTISGNTSNISGGGISHKDYGFGTTINLTNVTVVNNTTSDNGGGLYNDAAVINISQSIVSGNSAQFAAEILSSDSFIYSDDFNIFGESSSSGLINVSPGGNDIIPTEALDGILNPTLTDNGGLTPTHALIQSGPAVDAIPMASCVLASDQTGNIRPIDGNADGSADCDVGAVENPNPDIIFINGFN